MKGSGGGKGVLHRGSIPASHTAAPNSILGITKNLSLDFVEIN